MCVLETLRLSTISWEMKVIISTMWQNFLLDNLLRPEERDFNLITLFGAETDSTAVVQAAMGFPMGAEAHGGHGERSAKSQRPCST